MYTSHKKTSVNRLVGYTIGAIILSAFFFLSFSGIRKINVPESLCSQATYPHLVGVFVDSTLIGRPGRNKVETHAYQTPDSIYAEIYFYTKQNDTWILRQKEVVVEMVYDEEIGDFTNDGCGDLTYVSERAARGGNEIRSLWIYDSDADNLRYIRNSSDYPNLSYNEKLDCVDSYAVYGGSTTYFLRIQEDSLFCFADVTLYDKERTISVYNDQGKETFLLNDTLGNRELVHLRFCDYEPSYVLEELEEYTRFLND